MDLPLDILAHIVQSFTPGEVLQFLTITKKFARYKQYLCNQVHVFRSRDVQHVIQFTRQAESFPALTLVDLSGEWDAAHLFADKHVTNLVSKYTTLKHVNLSDRAIRGKCINTLAETNHLLESINVAHCRSMCEFAFLTLVESCPNLTHVNLEKCRGITHWSLVALANYCPRLKWLNVNSCHDITDTGLSMIGRQCPDLEHLDVGNCSEITHHCIQFIVSNCTRLQYLNVAHYCSDFENSPIDGLERIAHVVK